MGIDPYEIIWGVVMGVDVGIDTYELMWGVGGDLYFRENML